MKGIVVRVRYLCKPLFASRASEMKEAFFLRAEDGKFVGLWAQEDGPTRRRRLGPIPSPERTG
jgi:hypothetical protein